MPIQLSLRLLDEMMRKIDDEWVPSIDQHVLVRIPCQSGEVYITNTNETTESLLDRLAELRKHPKIAAQVLSITFAIQIHML